MCKASIIHKCYCRDLSQIVQGPKWTFFLAKSGEIWMAACYIKHRFSHKPKPVKLFSSMKKPLEF